MAAKRKSTKKSGAKSAGKEASAAKPSDRAIAHPGGYFLESMRPLTILVFLLPMVVLYELGSIFYLSDAERGVVETVEAQRLLVEFFRLFGSFGLYLPGIALVLVLLIQHLFSRDKWRVEMLVPVGMVFESAVLTAPLVMLAWLIGGGAAVGGMQGATEGALVAWPWQSRLTIAVGAGLYEELLFRMVGIALVHFVVVDLFRGHDGWGKLLAVFVTAGAFAVYHDVGLTSGSPDLLAFTFYFLGGAYFGALYLWRGFGLAVGVHVVYDVIVLLLINAT